MANRYWVGGSGTWNTTSTTNWSTSSGGSSGASVPTTADSVFFDQASTYTVTMTGGLTCLDFTVSAGTVTFATGTTPSIQIAGNISLAAGTTSWNSTGTVTVSSASSRTINTNNQSLAATSVSFGSGGTYTLQSDFSTAGTFAQGNATFNLNGYTLNCNAMSVVTVATGTAVLNANLSTINVTGAVQMARYGSSSGVSATFNLVDGTLNCSTFAGTETNQNSLSIAFGSSGVINLSGNNATIISIPYFDQFSYSGTPKFNCTYTGSTGTRTFNLGGGGGAISSKALNVTTDPAYTSGIYLGTATDTITLQTVNYSSGVYDLNLVNFAGNLTNANAAISGITIYGNLTLPANTGTFSSGASAWTLSAPTDTTQTITSNGRTLDFPVNISSSSNTILNGNLTIGSTRTFSITGSTTFDLNGYDLSCGPFSAAVSSAGTSTINATNSTITANGAVQLCKGSSSQTSVTLDLTDGTINCTTFNATDSNQNSVSLSFGDTGIINMSASNTTVLSIPSMDQFSYSGTVKFASTYTGSTGTRTFNLGGSGGATSDKVFDLTTDPAYTSGLYLGTATDTVALHTAAYSSGFYNFNLANFAGTVSNPNAAIFGITIYGNLTLPANTGTFSSGASAWTLSAPTGTTQTFTTNNRNLNFPVNITGAGTTSLDGNLTIGSTGNTIKHTQGTLLLNSYIITVPQFTSDGSTSPRTINFGTGKIVLNGNIQQTIWNQGAGTGFSVVGDNPLVESIGGGTGITKTITPGTPSEANTVSFSLLETTGTVTYSISNSNIRNLLLNGSQTYALGVTTPTIYGSFTHLTTNGTTTVTSTSGTFVFAATSGTKTITTPAVTYDFPWTFNGVGGTWQLQNDITLGSTRVVTLTAGTIDLNSYLITANSLSSNNSNARAINFGTSGGFVLGGNNATILDFTTATNFTYIGVPYINSTYTGATGTRTFNFGGTAGATPSNAFNVATTGTSGIVLGTAATDTVALTGTFDDVDLTGLTNTISNTVRTVYGNFTVPSTGGNIALGTNTTTIAAPGGPIANGYSAYFDGNGDTITTPSNAVLAPTGDFTIEAWVYATSTTQAGLVLIGNPAANAGRLQLSISGANFNFYMQNNALAEPLGASGLSGPHGILPGTWFHVAAVRSGNDYTIYINGTSIATTNSATAMTYATNVVNIGVFRASNVLYYWDGYVSNFRLVNGVAVYTGNFTPSTIPLTAIAGTSLLTLQNNTFIDNSTNNFTITKNGNASTNASSPFSGSSVTTVNVTTNGRSLDFPITIGDVNGTGNIQLVGNLTIGSTRTLTLNYGNLSLGSSTLTTGLFISNNSNTRRIDFGTGKMVLTANTTTTIWNTSTNTNLTVAGTPLVECQGGGTAVTKTINTSALSEANSISFSLLETTGTATYAFTAGNAIKNLITNGSQTVTNIAITIYGAFTHQTTNGTTTFTAGANTWTFAATSGSNNISPPAAGFTYDFPWTFNGAGGTWVIQNNLTIGATRALTFTNGTLDFNNKTLTGTNGITINGGTFTVNNTGGTAVSSTVPITHTSGNLNLGAGLTTTSTSGYTFTAGNLSLGSSTLTTPIFVSNNSNVRTLAFNTGKIVLNGSATATIWNTATTTNLTISGTPTVESIGGGTTVTKTINLGSNFDNTGTTGGGINLSLLETTGSVTYTFTASGYLNNLTINGLQTISNTALFINGNYAYSTSNGTTTFTAGTNSWTFSRLTAGTGSYTISPGSATYNFPWAIGFNGSGVSYRYKYTLLGNLALGATRSLTLGIVQLDFNNFSVTSGTSVIINTGGVASETSVTTSIINTGSSTFSTTLPITHTMGYLELGANLTTSSTSGYTLTAGTLGLNGFVLTTRAFLSSNGNTRSINFSTGKIVVNANTALTVWNTGTSTGFSYTGTSLVEFTGGGSAVTKTINTGTLTEAQSLNFSFIDTGGTPTYAFTTNNVVRNVIFNGAQTISNITITVYGDFLHQTANGTTTFTAGANIWTFAATNGIKTITTPAFTYNFPWTFNGVGGTWQLQNNLSLGSTRIFTLSNGTFDFNNFNVTQMSSQGITISTGTVTINNTGNSTFTTSFAFTHSSGTLNLGVNITSTNASGYTLTAGTLSLGSNTLTLRAFSSNNSNARTIDFGTGKIVLNGAVTATIWTTATVTNLTISGTPLVECIGGGAAVTKTITPGPMTEANSVSFSLLDTGGTPTYTITTGTSNVKNLLVNGAQTVTNTNIGIWGSFTHLTTNGTTTFGAGANAWIFAATSGSYNITNVAGFTYDFPWTFGSAASTAVWTIQNNLILGATRALTFTNGTLDFNNKTLTGSNGITMLTGSFRLNNTGGSTFTTNVAVTHTSGNLTLGTGTTTTNASGYTLTAGVLTLNNQTLTTPLFSSSNSGVRSINFGTTGQITLTGNNTTILNFATATNFTYAGTPRIYSDYTGATGTRTFNFGSTAGATATNVFNVSIGTSGTGIVIAAGTDIKALTGSFNTVNLLDLTGSLSNTTRSIYGDFYVPSGATLTAGTNITSFVTTGTQIVTSSGVIFDFPVTVNNTGTTQINGNLTLGSTRSLTLTAGTIDLLDNVISCQTLSSTNTNTRQIYSANFGQIILTGSSGTLLSMATATNFTHSAGIIIYSNTPGASAAQTRTFDFGSAGGATATNVFDVVMGTSGTGIVINPGTDTKALTGGFGNVDITGIGGPLSNTVRSIYGNFIIPASFNNLTAGTNATTFVTTTTQTITTNGVTVDFPVIVAATGTTTLAGNLTLGSSRAFTLTSGTFNLANFILTSGTLSSTNSNAREIAFGTSGQIALTGNSTTQIDMTIMNSFTYSGTPYFNSTGTGTRTFIFGSTSGAHAENVFNVSRTGTSGLRIGTSTDTITLTGGFNDIDLTGLTQTIANSARTVYGNLIIPASGGTLSGGTAATTMAGSTTSPITNGYSMYLDGATDYFTVPSNAAFAFGTGDFTVEAWVNLAAGTNSRLATNRTTQASQAGTWSFNLTPTTCSFTEVTTGEPGISGTFTSIAGTWAHVAACRSGSFTRLFVNGAQVGSGNQTTNFSTVQLLYIGTSLNESYLNGHISNLRIIKGQALYTAGFTPSTSPLTTTSQGATAGNVSLLTFQSRQTIDASANNFTLTPFGNSSISTFTPFSGQTAVVETLTTNGRTLDFPIVIGNGQTGPGIVRLAGALTIGNIRSLTVSFGTFDLNNFTVSSQTLLSNNSNLRSIGFGTTGQVTLVGNGTTILDFTTATGFTYTGTPRIYCTTPGSNTTRTLNFAGTAGDTATNVFDFSIGASGTGIVVTAGTTDTVTPTGAYNNYDLSGLSGTSQTVGLAARKIYGNYTIPASGGTITTGASATTFATTSTQTITAPRSFIIPIIIDNSGTTILGSNINISTNNLTLTNGTFDANSKSIICNSIIVLGGAATLANTSSSSFTTNVAITHTSGNLTLNTNLTTTAFTGYTLTAGNIILNNNILTTQPFSSSNSNVRGIYFGTGKIVLTGSSGSQIWSTATATNLTVTGSGLVESIGVSGSSQTTKTISMGALTGSTNFNLSLLEISSNSIYQLSTVNCNDLTINGVQTIPTNFTVNIFGNLTHSTTNGTTLFGAGTTAWTFASTSGSKTITNIAGFTYDWPWTFNGVGGGWTIQNNLTLGATRTITLTNGSVDFNNKTLSASTITVGAGSSTISNLNTAVTVTHSGAASILTLGSNVTTGAYTLTAGTLNFANFAYTAPSITWSGGGTKAFDFSTSGKFVINATTTSTIVTGTSAGFTVSGTYPLIECVGGGSGVTKTITTGALTEAQAIGVSLLETSGSVTYALGTSVFGNLIINGSQTVNNTAITIYGNYTYSTTNGLTVFPSGTNAWTFASTSGTEVITSSPSGVFGSSVNFDGTSGYLSIPYNANQALTNQNFTIEAWVYPLAASGAVNVINTWYGVGVVGGQYLLQFDVNGRPQFVYTTTGDIQTNLVGTTTSVRRYTWNHLAVVRNSGTITMYVNGIADATTGSITTNSIIYRGGTVKDIRIGADTAGSAYTTGYISNVRQVIGTAVYTGNFAPPSLANLATSGSASAAAYPSTTNVNVSFAASQTNLLTCQSSTQLVDNSNNAFTVTVNGNCGPTPFGVNNILYDFPWTFNGAGGTWQLQSSVYSGPTRTVTLTAGNLNLSNSTLITGIFSSSGSTARTLAFGTGKISLIGTSTATIWNTGTVTNLTTTGSRTVESTGGGTAVTKTITVGSLSEANAINLSLLETTGTVTYAPTGSVANLIVDGTQTITNSALTINDSFTHSNNNGDTLFSPGANAWTFAASSGSHSITTGGNSLFSTGSVGFSTTNSDSLLVPGNAAFAVTTSTTPFTIEAWICPTADGSCIFTDVYTGAGNTIPIVISMADGTSTQTTTGRTITIGWYNGSAWTAAAGASTALTLGRWTHIACVFTGATTKIYYDGVDVTKASTPTPATTWGVTGVNGDGWYIGRRWDGAASPVSFTGFISNFRFVKGVAVYTGNFTPPTLAPLATSGSASAGCYPSTTNVNTSFASSATSLLTCQSTSQLVDNSDNAFTITKNGSAAPYAFGPRNAVYDYPWNIGTSGTSATWQLNSNLTLGLTRQLTLNFGTFDFNNRQLIASGVTLSNASNINLLDTGGSTLNLFAGITHTAGNLTLPFNISVESALGYTLTAGTLALSNYNLTTPIFSSSNSNTRTIDFGNGKVLLNGSSTATIWNTGTITGLTTSGSRLVESTGGGTGITKTITLGALSESNAISLSLLETSGTVTYAPTGSVANLIINGSQTVNNGALTIYDNFTHSISNGVTTLPSGTNTWTFAGTSGTYNITAPSGSSANLSSVYFSGTDDYLSIAAGSLGNLSVGDFTVETWFYPTVSSVQQSIIQQGEHDWRLHMETNDTLLYVTSGTARITSSAVPINRWNHVAISKSGSTTTMYLNGVSQGTTTSDPLGTTNNIFIGINNANIVGTVWDFTGYISNTRIVKGAAVYTGNFTPPNLASLATSGAGSANAYSSTTNVNTTFNSSATVLLTCQSSSPLIDNSASNLAITVNGDGVITTYSSPFAGDVTYDFPWTFNGSNATWNLRSPITIGTTRTTTLTNGNINLNSNTLTLGLFATAAGTKSIVFNGGAIRVNGSGATAWNNAQPTNFTTSAGTASGIVSMTSASAKTFVGGGSNYAAALDQGGAGTLTVTGSNTFDDFTVSIATTANATVSFTSGTTTTFNNFTTQGTSSYKPTINSATTNSAATFYSPAALNGIVSGADYLQVRDINFTPFTTDGTDFIRWHIGVNSVITNNCTGVLAQNYVAGITPKVYVIESGTEWSVPNDFNTSNNTMHLIGGGGGGGRGATATSGTAGGGGGGAGYTQISNISLHESQTISYLVGSAGLGATTANTAGGDGGSTVFGSYTAGGGFGGKASRTGGAAGTGLTFNGGAGGTGGTNAGGAGGGGGGAGGPFGNGGNGGNGGSRGDATTKSGGGGGGNGGGGAGSNGTYSVASTYPGGRGGNNAQGAGGGTSQNVGLRGGGGGGGSAGGAARGGHGVEILWSVGSGGGSGGGGTNSAGAGDSRYGGGGGGGGHASENNTGSANGGNGGPGVIIIQYVPVTPKFLSFFA